MTIVKGSKQTSLKVVESRPWLPILLTIIVIIVVVLASGLAYKIGFTKGAAEKSVLESSLSDVSQAIEALAKEKIQLEQQLAHATLNANVDRQSSEDVRKEIATLSAKLAKLEDDNRFYRNLMAPTKNKLGVSFGAIELVEAAEDSRFNFKIVVQQLSTKHNTVSGSLRVRVTGVSNGLPAVFNLSDLSPDIANEKIKLRFKYFQTIEGSLTLPEGFNASGIDLTVTMSGKNAEKIEKKLGWLVEKR